MQRRRVVPNRPFGSDNLRQPIAQPSREARLSLNANLDSLHGAKSDVGDELGRGRSSEIDQGLVFESVFRSSNVGVVFLEELVESVLAGALSAVAEQSWRPASEETSDALLPEEDAEAGGDAFVFRWIDLYMERLLDFESRLLRRAQRLYMVVSEWRGRG